MSANDAPWPEQRGTEAWSGQITHATSTNCRERRHEEPSKTACVSGDILVPKSSAATPNASGAFRCHWRDYGSSKPRTARLTAIRMRGPCRSAEVSLAGPLRGQTTPGAAHRMGMTENTARQPKGIPAGGQFAATSHPEPEVALAGGASEAPDAAGILAANSEPVTLRYVAYDDRLTAEQINMILAGQWVDAENDVDENYSDSSYEQAVTTARSELESAVAEGRFDREWDDLDPDEQDNARYAIEARDDSDPVKDLLRNTPPQLLRTSLGGPTERLSEPRWASGHRQDDGGFEARHQAVSALLKDSGMEVESREVREAIDELVTEGPYDWHEGVQLDVIWYGDVEDAVPTPRAEAPETEGRKVLEFASPHILLIDKWNGSGHDVVIPSVLKRTLTRVGPDDAEAPQSGRAYLDSNAGGYGWDSVAGVYKPAYSDGAPAASWSGSAE